MADLTVTAASVVPQAGATIKNVISTTTITQGQAVYRDPATQNKLRKCANSSAAVADCYGIALNAAGIGQPCNVCTAGTIYIASDALAGHVYGLSSTTGAIADIGDSEDFDLLMTVIGICRADGYLDVNIDASGVARASAP